ncbi:N-6 DNA methylase [Spirulina sp. CS-785/01]|uniref:type ISP restriction/modification enzyme n=1 Tax=Spirulina sp. CS-785/01 TaxID=3021716 RepID=UPI00232D2E65|nr:type ISP restriction/modification enzyme [Spirulina sp. CS-785/01]MDB9312342.1 N-6 DNA methylase [Spirulina sp. CS-785/01]
MNLTHYLQTLENNNLERASERTHYPALQTLIESAKLEITASIEERSNQAGIPDFTVRKNNSLLGYIEAKQIDANLDKIEETEQLQRYFESSIGNNFILTNYLEFRWYLNGKLKAKAIVAQRDDNKIIPINDAIDTENLILSFLNYTGKAINNYYDLARQMAATTKAIRYGIKEGLRQEDSTGELRQLYTIFEELLLPQLNWSDFADMYAQTIAYGLFTARVGHAQEGDTLRFDRQTASIFISDKIPFLKGLFYLVIATDIVSKIHWTIEQLIELLAKVEMGNILENFGQETDRQDPIVHFYETFLAAYDASLRKSRGVYYTPESVVSFIVKAVNDILDQDFDLEYGLGSRKVTILDPATGTGTFLYAVIKQIRANFEKYGVNRWNLLFRDNKVLSRLYGFELLMTPYTIAHLKLGLLLERLGYEFADKERLKIYLSNALDEGKKKSEMLLGKYISEEANQAADVKNEIPIYVVLGNPPYSGHSENFSPWIGGLVRDYYQVDGNPLNEKNPKWLQDDYVKFIRFGQWKIDQTHQGILGFVTNHGYLDNPTFRGMRQRLLESFDRIYILDLHGNAKKKEVCPDGSPDQNVFDIQQGVCIGIFVKDGEKSPSDLATVYHAEVWGSRESKYQFLTQVTLETVEWEVINPVSPFYLLIPQMQDLWEEYAKGWKITEIMPINSLGVVTARDSLTIQWTREDVANVVNDFASLSEKDARFKYNLGKDSKEWNVSVAKQDLLETGVRSQLIMPILYRPFDTRFTYYTGKSRGFICRPRNEVMSHVIKKENLCLISARGIERSREYDQVLCTNKIITNHTLSLKENNSLFPLYIYPDTDNQQTNLFLEKHPNLSPEFLQNVRENMGKTPTPEEIFYYLYAILHSPTYRQRYADFLKRDFPRLPITSNQKLFQNLAKEGGKLVNLHLMKSPQLKTLITEYHGEQKPPVSQVKYNETKQEVIIHKNCRFSGIPKRIWEFKVGGYQVLEKWLKDRKKAKRQLSSEEILHYQKIVVVLTETQKIMTHIDQLIPDFPFA